MRRNPVLIKCPECRSWPMAFRNAEAVHTAPNVNVCKIRFACGECGHREDCIVWASSGAPTYPTSSRHLSDGLATVHWAGAWFFYVLRL